MASIEKPFKLPDGATCNTCGLNRCICAERGKFGEWRVIINKDPRRCAMNIEDIRRTVPDEQLSNFTETKPDKWPFRIALVAVLAIGVTIFFL